MWRPPPAAGTTLPLHKRQQLVRLAHRYGFTIVADEVYQLLSFPNSPDPPPPMKVVEQQMLQQGLLQDEWHSQLDGVLQDSKVGHWRHLLRQINPISSFQWTGRDAVHACMCLKRQHLCVCVTGVFWLAVVLLPGGVQHASVPCASVAASPVICCIASSTHSAPLLQRDHGDGHIGKQC